MNITDIRKKNVEIARKSSNETNTLKGIKKYVLGKSKKQKLQNEIIDELIENVYYKMIYNNCQNLNRLDTIILQIYFQ